MRVALENDVFLVSKQPQLECFDDGEGDLILQLENVAHLAVVGLRPGLETVSSIYQLYRDTQSIARFSDAALENIFDAEFFTDLVHVYVLALKEKRRGPSGDLQLIDLGQRT